MRCVNHGMIAGLMLGLVCVGCEKPGGNFKTAKQIKQENKAAGTSDHVPHDHSAGPHGGAIVELGDDEYHAEVVVDGKTHTLAVYMFGSDAKTVTPIAATEVIVVTEDDKSLSLKATPQDGDGEGKSSKFELADEATVKPIAEAGFLHGDLKLEIDGKPYHGAIDSHFDGSSHDDHADKKTAEPNEDKPGAEAKSPDDASEKTEK
jgi:hypothetical protein